MNSLLNLPTDHMLANIAGVFVCLAIVIASICRINISEPKRARMTLEQVMLLCFALWAAGTMLDLLHGKDIGWHGAAVGLGIMIYLVLSFRQWKLQDALRREAQERQAFAARSRLHVSVEDPGARSLHC